MSVFICHKLCNDAFINSHTLKQDVTSKHLWDNVVLHHFTDNEWKNNFRLTQQSFIILNKNNISSFGASYCTSLHHFYVNAHAPNFSVLVFCLIKCV